MFRLLFLFGLLIVVCDTKRVNNVCKNFQDYTHYSTSKNCFYNSDTLLQTPQLIKKYTGNVETYQSATLDGYILTLFRIRRSNPKGVVLLQHPLTLNSRVWVGQGYNSFAFYLWRNGYEVWLNNMRGTQYSELHRSLKALDMPFWNYSFHEIGKYDIPCQIKLIKETAKSNKIIYIGHSLGVTTGLIYASLLPEDAKNDIETFVFLATPCYFKFATTILKSLALLESLISDLVAEFRLGNVLAFPGLQPISRFILRLFPRLLAIVNALLCLVNGWTPLQADPAFINFDFFNNLKSFSWKTVIHYAQLVRIETRFQMFDYGEAKNFQYYKSKTPPEYPLWKISVPIMFVSSYNDSLTTLKDTDLVIQKLPKNLKVNHLKMYDLNHLDFFWGKDRKDRFFGQVLTHIDVYAQLLPT